MPRRTASRLAAFALAVAAVLVPAPASAQSGGVGFRVDGTPGSVMDAGYITIAANPGSSASGHFFMTNGGSAGAQLRVYPADGLTGVTTGVVYGTADAALVEAGAWLTPDVSSVDLAPRAERRVDFAVNVPPDATGGDHVGAIVFEQKGKGSAQVSQIVRHVAPVRIVVGNGPSAQVRIRSAKITALPGTTLPAITVALRNLGARMCAPVLTVALRGPSEKGREVARQLDMILPSDRAPYPMPWPREIRAGTYVARVVTTGCGETDAITVTLEAPESFSPTSDAVTAGGGKPTPSLVTDAPPGESVYRDGDDQTDEEKAKPKKKGTTSSTTDGGAASAADTGGADGGAAAPPGGKGPGDRSGARGAAASGGEGATEWIKDALGAAAEAAPEVIKRATIPLLLLALVGLLFFIQETMDRRDPKLALAPLHREPHLPFDPDPLHTRRVIPSPTLLRTDP